MPFLLYELETETRGRVTLIHNKPELLSEETRRKGVEVDELLPITEDDVKIGKTIVRYVNPQTKEQWFEYEDRELTNEEKLQQKIELLEGSVMELTMALALALAGQGGND